MRSVLLMLLPFWCCHLILVVRAGFLGSYILLIASSDLKRKEALPVGADLCGFLPKRLSRGPFTHGPGITGMVYSYVSDRIMTSK